MTEQPRDVVDAALSRITGGGMTCARCKQETSNYTQGHYWALCKVTGTMRGFHFCCPSDCALEADGGEAA